MQGNSCLAEDLLAAQDSAMEFVSQLVIAAYIFTNSSHEETFEQLCQNAMKTSLSPTPVTICVCQTFHRDCHIIFRMYLATWCRQ